jgi:hypothetical protein
MFLTKCKNKQRATTPKLSKAGLRFLYTAQLSIETKFHVDISNLELCFGREFSKRGDN